ncbi:MAG TPA: cytochrome C oxidase subunit IV family protein [Polyangia bacterium]|nr:cytochrome C oxidase subunit IV family protein [Polyangia bacterium]
MAERKHVTGLGYALTFLALIVLATLSLVLSLVHWPIGDLAISLVIAAIKAVLVLWFFMHLVEQRFANRFVVAVSVGFVALLVGLAAADVVTRHTYAPRPEPPRDEPFYRR